MQWSYSRVDCFERCPYHFRLRYLDRIELMETPEANNALVVGTALHHALELGIGEAVREYKDTFNILTDRHVEEIIKLEAIAPKAKAVLPEGGEFEVRLSCSDFIGFIDYLVPVGNGEYDLYDFKYSNNIDGYLKSRQLHVYKYAFEQLNPKKRIRNLYFLFAPKMNIRQKKTEGINEFRKRLRSELEESEPRISVVAYDPQKVKDFYSTIKFIEKTNEYPKNVSYLCRWCEYEGICKREEKYMILPENERRTGCEEKRRVIWVYGAPFSGKTTFANGFPDPLMLNTDGNIKYVDAPYIRIRNEIKMNGRMKEEIPAWAVFKEVVDELEKKENDFKTIVVDLLEDLYEYCRTYMYPKMKVEHESDNPFKTYDMVRKEFLDTIKRLLNLDYENIILISHEDTARDLTKKNGDKLSIVKPNMQDKVANKVAGMVDIVARVKVDGKNRYLSLKTDETVFGGGRLKIRSSEIPLKVEDLFELYERAIGKE